MAILKNVGEKFGNVKITFLKYLTPLEYLEFTFKMILVLDISKVEFCLWLSTGLLAVMFGLNFIFPLAISSKSLLVACLLSAVCNFIFIKFRKFKSTHSQIEHELKDIKVTEPDLDLKITVPSSLKKYIKRGE